MNFLAHAYLSFDHEQVLVGNMTSDFIKGAKQYSYPPLIQSGIRLHREIDSFTDQHQATHEGKRMFREDYGLYAGAILDVLYDHFLANDPAIFPPGDLQPFADKVYVTLENNASDLPAAFLLVLPYMKSQNWLYNYKERKGIERSLRGLVKRAAFLYEHETAFRLFEEHYAVLEACYQRFIPDVKEFAKQRLRQLISG
jgi:acyl carrier protein phosphodiesterase